MGRQLRRVPAGWEHPCNAYGNYIPLHVNFGAAHARWLDRKKKWDSGLRPVPNHNTSHVVNYDWIPVDEWERLRGNSGSYPVEDYFGLEPKAENYVPDWDDADRTCFQFYESTTEGTPISPVFPTMDELCEWLAENETLWGGKYGTKEEWLEAFRTCVDWQPV